MTSRHPTHTTRRHAIKFGIGGLAALGMTQAVQLGAAPAVSSGGLAGGGRAMIEGGEVQLAVFGTRLAVPGQAEEQIVGRVQWFDAGWTPNGTVVEEAPPCGDPEAPEGAGLFLETIEVSAYGPIADVENGREMRGTMSMNGDGSYPFVLRAVDAGPPGTQEDTISLLVGAAAEESAADDDAFGYSAEATLIDGDLQLLDFVIAGS